MLYLICKKVHTSNLMFFPILAAEKCSRTKVIEITSRYLSSIKYFWQTPEKQNKCIVLSCFRAASTAAFKSQCNQQAEGSAIPTKRKMLPPATLLQKVMRTHLFRQLQWWRGPTTQDTIHTGAQLGALGKVNTWTSPSPLPLELAGCVQGILTLMIPQPKLAPCHSPCFLFGFKRICLEKAQHNENIKNFRVKAINHTQLFQYYIPALKWTRKNTKKAKQIRTKTKTEQD